jgi:glutamate racemase
MISIDNRPIGIFDSGLGGLTVLKTLSEIYPDEHFIYIGDIARLPYGNKSPETVRKYGEQILNYLIKFNVKLAIIACNTASSVFIDETTFNGLPLFNVITPGAQAAFETSKTKRIGVIGTRTTIQGHSYKNTLLKLSPDLFVIEKACPLFVPLAEEGWLHGDVPEMVAESYLKGLRNESVDTLILGCTHYPILDQVIAQVMGPDVNLIESGKVLARILKSHLSDSSKQQGTIKILATDMTQQFQMMAELILGKDKIFNLELINL